MQYCDWIIFIKRIYHISQIHQMATIAKHFVLLTFSPRIDETTVAVIQQMSDVIFQGS